MLVIGTIATGGAAVATTLIANSFFDPADRRTWREARAAAVWGAVVGALAFGTCDILQADKPHPATAGQHGERAARWLAVDAGTGR